MGDFEKKGAKRNQIVNEETSCDLQAMLIKLYIDILSSDDANLLIKLEILIFASLGSDITTSEGDRSTGCAATSYC